MAMWTVIVKNPGGSAVEIEDLGISIPASGQEELSEQFTFSELADSDDLRALALATTLTINDGTSDLTAANAVAFLTFIQKEHLEDNYYNKTELSTSGQSVVDWGNVANAPSFGSPSWVDGVKYRVETIAAAAPGSPTAGDVYVDTDDQHYYKYNGATWDDEGAAVTGDRVIKLDEGDEAIFEFTSPSTWTDQGTPDDNTGVIVEDDGDGKAAQYVYNGTTTSWIKIADADFAEHLDGVANGKHDADQIDLEGTFTNIPGSPSDVEAGFSALDTKQGTQDTAIGNAQSAADAAQSDIDDHTDGTASKHDASEIDDENTYTNILGSPSDVDATLTAIDTAIGVVQSNLDDHEDNAASKHDADQIDDENTYTNIPGSPTNVDATLTQIDNQLGTLAGQIPTEFNTLDEAYDEGGAGAGRSIDADSGAVKITPGGNFAPFEIVPSSLAPTNGLAGGQFWVHSTTGILYVYDATRSKWLSVNRFFIAFGRKGNTKNQMLSYYVGSLKSNNSGLRVLRNATIVGATGQLDATGTCDMRLRRNDTATNLATLTISSALGAVDGSINVDVSINDYLQAYLEASTRVQDPTFMLEMAWRA